ncbi:signal-regulatory protein gamma-like [Dendropsophus ebraccatus]|uniref:signal-regulatory protein gamma-like n=1 Tax=Dendropsophus ebraccatus TaxID=150705 RepID=UPI0038315063
MNNDLLGLRLKPVVSRDKLVFYKCICSIHIIPKFKGHHRATLSLDVHHPALKNPICKAQLLKVKSVPEMKPIRANQESYKVGDQLELTCTIDSFCPKSIQVLWYQDQEEISSQNMDGVEDGSGLYSVTSSMQCRVTEDDIEKIFRCKAVHQCKSFEAAQWKLEKEQTRPILDPIQANQDSYSAGDRLQLKCKIHSFYPLNIGVTWWKDQEALPPETYDLEDNEAGDFYVTACMNNTIKEEDFGKAFTCRVRHRDKNYEIQWILETNTGDGRNTE